LFAVVTADVHDLHRYAAVWQCVDLNCVLPHLDGAETLSQLDYAGGKKEIFTDKIVDDIYKEPIKRPRCIAL